jgi:hypothetical protein
MKEIQDELKRAQRDAGREAEKVLKRAALNIKKDAQARSRGIRYAPAYHRAIGYDTAWRGDAGWAEIGPDKDRRQGALGNILEYGTINNAPRPHLGPALDAEVPRFVEQLEKLGEELLE